MSAASGRCLITGCEMYDAASNKSAHGDLFSCGDVFVFNAVTDPLGQTTWTYNSQPPASAFVLTAVDYWERRGVIIVPKGDAQLNQSAVAYIGHALGLRANQHPPTHLGE